MAAHGNMNQRCVVPPWALLQAEGNALTPRRGRHSAVVWQGAMWVWGGVGPDVSAGTMEVFACAERVWRSAPCPQPWPPLLHAHSAVVANGRMVVFGGCEASGGVSNALYSLDFASLRWACVTPACGPCPRSGHAAVALPGGAAGANDSMAVYGGADSCGQPLDDLWLCAFTPEAPVWRRVATSALYHIPRWPGPRYAATMTRVDASSLRADVGVTDPGAQHVLCVLGGTNGRDMFSCHLIVVDAVEGAVVGGMLCGGADDCDSLFHPAPRCGHAVVVANSRVYVLGGRAAEGGLLSDAFRMSLAYLTWVRLHPPGFPPSPRVYHTACATESHVYVFGGDVGGRVANDLYVMDLPGANTTLLTAFTAPKLVFRGEALSREVMLEDGGGDVCEDAVLVGRRGGSRAPPTRDAPTTSLPLFGVMDEDGGGAPTLWGAVEDDEAMEL
eukprot:TRINITY_DN27326_c0_g1_i1.p1 TRINITY_DN27326_c0_g1~~TRINITY_DN27326_c0_g1_i1.p1  ORF type:complete len:467 (+),score=78.65 TRINITY_DN27326_c0_g1_i1:71-1402(+)